MIKKGADILTKIAPKSGGGKSWTSKEWLEAKKNDDWNKMIQIFADRINGRYFIFIKKIKEHPYSGFAVMALGCTLIETLHQFYKGIESSDKAVWDCGHRMNNSDFYVQFLTQSSFVFKNYFKDKKLATVFYTDFRCGLAHQAETKSNSKIRRKKDSLLFEPTRGGLIIYQEIFVDLLEQEINSYIEHLKTNDIPVLRKCFTKKMDYICRVEFEELEN